MNKKLEIKGIFLAIFAAILFGTHPTFVHFLRSENMEVIPTLIISGVQCIIIYFLILLFSKKLDTLKINIKQFIKLTIVAILFYSTLWVLFFSYTKIPSGLATVVHFIYPSLVTILSIITKRDKLTKSLLLAILFTFLGVFLISNTNNQNINPIGILLAILSAIIFSLYIFMINDKSFKELNNTAFVFYTTLIGTIFLLLATLIEKKYLIPYSTNIWGTYSNKVLIGALSLGITQAIGVLALANAIKYIGGPMGGAFAAFEPLSAVIIGVIFFSESMTIFCFLGCLLILCSTIYLSFDKIKEKR